MKDKKKVETVKRGIAPLSVYWMKDVIRQLVSNKNFQDALIMSLALASMAIAFPFLPVYLLAPVILLIFVLALIHPLLGLMTMLLSVLPMLIYQSPLLVWLFTIIISISLILGYKYYRTIAFTFALVFLSLSYLGYLLVIPGFIISILVLGFKRGAILSLVVIVLSVMVSGLTGIALSGPIVYNSTFMNKTVAATSLAKYLTPTKHAAVFGNLISSWTGSLGALFSTEAMGNLYNVFYYALLGLWHDLPFTLIQICIWLLVVFTISNYAIKSRSPYKGSFSSFFGIVLLASYFLFSRIEGLGFNPLIIVGFLITPVFLFSLEAAGIDVVMALDVMKQDILGKFGVAFEDLTKGSGETFDDVADYAETKKELRNAVMAPIEHREISGAYGVSPAKGILLFGPPGTGKTLIMRALANELRASFYYVNAASLLSAIPGSSAQALVKIFSTAKKNAPCVLFFDELDSIGGRREVQRNEAIRELLTAMLSEMDGFQKISKVVIVGATNAPQLLDPALLRPGRFDKILYMPLPDQVGRAEIFKYYLSKLPIDKDMDYDKLAGITLRFSGADIKNVCDEVARQVGEQAIAKHAMLIIRLQDILAVIKAVNPSTSLSQLEAFNTFKLDYERRLNPEMQAEKGEKVSLGDVVGLDEAKKALEEAIELPIIHPELIKKYGVGGVRGILLFGPPGTGKTMLINATANKLPDVRVLTLSGYDVTRRGPDAVVASIREIFDRAKEHPPAIVFIDEIDALVPARDTTAYTGAMLTGEILEEFDKIKDATGIVVVASTNRPDVLDAALLRPGRFDKLIFVPAPQRDDREKLFEQNLKKVPVSDDLDFGKLADMTEGFTGADIANICRQVKINALQTSLSKGGEAMVEMSDVTKILAKAKPSAPSSVMGRYMAFLSRYGKR